MTIMILNLFAIKVPLSVILLHTISIHGESRKHTSPRFLPEITLSRIYINLESPIFQKGIGQIWWICDTATFRIGFQAFRKEIVSRTLDQNTLGQIQIVWMQGQLRHTNRVRLFQNINTAKVHDLYL